MPPSSSDNLIETTFSGNLYSIGGKTGKLSPYIYLPPTRSLTQNCHQAVAKACANTGSANNFASAGFIQKLGAKVISVEGRTYNYKDASQNAINVVGETRIFLQLPNEKSKRFLEILVTDSWCTDTILIGIDTFASWKSISSYFPLPVPPDCQEETEVLSIHGGKSITPFVIRLGKLL